jgi:ABC-2 type transport system permease protein
MLFVDIQIHSYSILIFTVLLTSMVFSLAGLINAIFANSFDDISIIPTFILTPLTYLGGVFYSLTLLPEIWQDISKINPIVYMVNAFRYGFLGVSDVDLTFAVAMIVGFTVIFFSLALYLINKGIGIRS